LTEPSVKPSGEVPGVVIHDSIFPTLADIGWDALRDSELINLAGAVPGAPNFLGGRITRRDRRTALVAFGGREAACRIAKRLLGDPLEQPTTGDFVAVAGEDIVAVLERRTSVMRASFRSLDAQVMAANVDHVLVSVSLANKFRAGRIERLLVIAWQTGAVPIVVLTKGDTCDDRASAYQRTKALAPGAAVHIVSSVTGEGLAELAADLSPRTTAVIIGPSGAGKSTLANALGAHDHLATQEVRGDGKGRHTTVTRELVRLGNGALMIDTPGLRSIGLWDAEEALDEAFSDVEELVGGCRFNDCAHESEPGCAVTAAIAGGLLDPLRLESYKRLLREQRQIAARTDPRLRAERLREHKALVRSVKGVTRR
jgi:ribosome biogenesis GTPase